MDILKHGKMYVEKDCPACGAKLGFLKSEIQYKQSTEPFTTEDYLKSLEFRKQGITKIFYIHRYIVCPECISEVDVGCKRLIDDDVDEYMFTV